MRATAVLLLLLLQVDGFHWSHLARNHNSRILPRPVKVKLRHKRLQKPYSPWLSALSISRLNHFSKLASSDPLTVGLREQGHAYYGNLVVGSQGQQVTVVFDTGSANLVVPGSSCKDCSSVRFDPSFTQTGRYLDDTGRQCDESHARHASIDYASGSVSGVAYEDKVCVGDSNGVCGNSRFLMVQEESSSMRKFHFDGILGLAPPGDFSMGDGYSLLSSLVQSGALPAAMVSFSFGNNPEVMLGGYDPSKETALTWLPLADRSEWKVKLDDITVKGESLGIAGQAILDSGCGNIAVPSGIGRRISKALNFAGSTDQCNNLGSLPNIGFILGGKSFELTPNDYIEVSKVDSAHCRLYTRDLPDSEEFILGHPFLARYYSVYDQDNFRVGLAPS